MVVFYYHRHNILKKWRYGLPHMCKPVVEWCVQRLQSISLLQKFYLTVYPFDFFPPAIVTQKISLMYCDFPLPNVKLQGVLFIEQICQENLKSIESQPTNTHC